MRWACLSTAQWVLVSGCTLSTISWVLALFYSLRRDTLGRRFTTKGTQGCRGPRPSTLQGTGHSEDELALVAVWGDVHVVVIKHNLDRLSRWEVLYATASLFVVAQAPLVVFPFQASLHMVLAAARRATVPGLPVILRPRTCVLRRGWARCQALLVLAVYLLAAGRGGLNGPSLGLLVAYMHTPLAHDWLVCPWRAYVVHMAHPDLPAGRALGSTMACNAASRRGSSTTPPLQAAWQPERMELTVDSEARNNLNSGVAGQFESLVEESR
eukprot:scaffold3_cov389-Prasinococcus_capsulatus_cf.AAC.3